MVGPCGLWAFWSKLSNVVQWSGLHHRGRGHGGRGGRGRVRGNGNIGGEFGDGGWDKGRGYARGRGCGRGHGFRGRGRGGYGGPVDVQHDVGGYNDEAPFQAQGRGCGRGQYRGRGCDIRSNGLVHVAIAAA